MNTSVWPPMLKRTYNVRTQLKSFSIQVLEISNTRIPFQVPLEKFDLLRKKRLING